MAYPYRKPTGINGAQIKLIKTLVRQLGIDDDTYRDMLQSVAGVRSAKDLNEHAFDAVLKHLRTCGAEQTSSGYFAAKKKWDVLGNRPGMATAAQLARIETDWTAMKSYWEPKGFPTERAALLAFIKKIAKVDDLRFLEFGQARQVLTVMEKIKTKEGEA